MSRHDLGIALSKKDFSEVGNPFSPDSKNTAIKRKDKADYDDYCGTIYLDATNPYPNTNIYTIFIITFGILGVLALFIPVYHYYLK